MFESIGQRLKKERIARFLTLEKASEATRIRIIFLQALESDDYSVMPSAAQGRGFLRNYAEYLELNIDDCILYYINPFPLLTEYSIHLNIYVSTFYRRFLDLYKYIEVEFGGELGKCHSMVY